VIETSIAQPSPSSSQPYQPAKKVFVSLPEKNNVQPSYAQYQPRPIQQEQVKPVEQKSHSPINIQESEETKLETKYTQSLDEIKEMYVNTLVQRKTRNRRKELVKKYMKPVMASLFLLIAGVAIGYVITNKRTTLQASQGISTVIPNQKTEDTVADNNPILVPEEKQATIPQIENKIKQDQHQQASVQPKKEEQKITLPTNQTGLTSFVDDKNKPTFLQHDEVANVQKQDIEVDPQTGERRKVTRNDDNNETAGESKEPRNEDKTAKTAAEPRSLNKLVSIKTNDYIRGTFGGIRDLKLTVSNNSKYFVDEVKVELQYIKPSQQPLRIDIITFRNLSPNGSVTIKVPDSQRGMRVDYRITRVQSRDWEKSTAGL
jgi:hypothetical protein